MNNGYLSQYFEAVAAKKLSSVEVDPAKSHQHEFNGSKELKAVLRTSERTKFQTTFLWIEEENEALSEEGTVTWYDAREDHPTRSEFRLFYPGNAVTSMAKEGDTMFIARRTDNTILIVITSAGSTIEHQLYWLFGLEIPSGTGFKLSEMSRNNPELDFAARFILDELGIEIEEPENDRLDLLLKDFGGAFPSIAEFSKFARSTCAIEVNPIEDPDSALLAYMDWEEKLFRRLERHIVSKRLREGFTSAEDEDVEGFIQFSLGVQNRRKTRAGNAFEDHFENILANNKVAYSRKKETENKAKPDFVFPNIDLYRVSAVPDSLLTMIGLKTTCKDRWRQVLPEAARIKEKHLLTLEPGISENQTNEMKAYSVQLILPSSLHKTYSNTQRSWLMDVKSFISLVKNRQSEIIVKGFQVL